MNIKEISLRKEELPILAETSFSVPIYPRLLDRTLKINPRIPQEIFEKVANEWYEELIIHNSNETDPQKRSWITDIFLEERPKFENHLHRKIVKHLYWEDLSISGENGFSRGLSINRNNGGSLYFNQEDQDNQQLFIFGKENRLIKMPDEKARQYTFQTMSNSSGNYGKMHVYLQHNIDHYPGALFLRNWAIEYINEAIRQTFG